MVKPKTDGNKKDDKNDNKKNDNKNDNKKDDNKKDENKNGRQFIYLAIYAFEQKIMT